jgi:hypothetical protein
MYLGFAVMDLKQHTSGTWPEYSFSVSVEISVMAILWLIGFIEGKPQLI